MEKEETGEKRWHVAERSVVGGNHIHDLNEIDPCQSCQKGLLLLLTPFAQAAILQLQYCRRDKNNSGTDHTIVPVDSVPHLPTPQELGGLDFVLFVPSKC